MSEVERVFPHVPNARAFFDRFADHDHWRPGAEALREEVGLSHMPMERVLRGSNLVYGLGDELILKCYAPPFREDGEVELAILDAISPQAEALLAPRLEESGERDGWLYMVQTRLDGETLSDEHWRAFAPHDRKRLAERLGEWAADFAQSEAQAITLPGGRADWQGLQRTQRENVTEQQRERGLSEEWCEQFEAFFAGWKPRDAQANVHADLHLGNLLYLERDGVPQLSAVLDYADGQRAPHIYDALAPLVYLGRGEREVIDVVCDAWGVSDESPEELMRWILLHRFSHLPHYLTWPSLRDCGTLHDMASVFASHF